MASLDLKSDPLEGESLGIECRRSAREAVVALARLAQLPPGVDEPPDDFNPIEGAFQVLVMDVSLHGCSFRTPEPVQKGAQRYVIDIRIGPMRMRSTLQIVRLTVRPDGVNDCGAEFI